MSRILGIDYGTKKMGLALSDESVSFAFPFTVIPVTSYEDVFFLIKKFCDENDVGKIVLGKPEGFKGNSRKILEKINNFKTHLEKKVGLPVVYENEVLTTQQAKRPFKVNQPRGKLSNARISTSNTRGVDASAAAIILQSHIDKNSK
ncbi:MAG: Holliday junction resolvase RuvX [Candidatus Marinimicrobia bacterium]|nr:Holliday junction resolvase RuvX [Candidatus Neomarinimicrobiota bacterium]